MKTTVNNLPDSKVELEVEISPEELNNFIDQAVSKIGENLEVEGFRKGKAPKNIVEQKVGKESILVDAADLAIKENYPKAVLENKIEPIDQPEVDVIKLAPDNPFIFKVRIPVMPKIKLPDYLKIAKKVDKQEVSVKDEEIQNALNWVQKTRSKLTLKNEAIAKGDFAEIQYSSSQIKEITEPKKDGFVIGEGHFVPGFEDNLIGMKAQEEKEFTLTMPEKYPAKELANKQVQFKVKVLSVQKVELPEINDEFAKSMGKFEDLETLKNNIRDGLTQEKKESESQRFRNEILEKISQGAGFEVPKVLIEREQKVMMHNFEHEVSDRLNMPVKEYLAKINKTEEDVLDSFIEEAKRKVRNFLILREIEKKEDIQVSDEEIREEVNKILKANPVPKEKEKDIDYDRLKEYARNILKNEKVFQLLEK